jgi:hypothetical protein
MEEMLLEEDVYLSIRTQVKVFQTEDHDIVCALRAEPNNMGSSDEELVTYLGIHDDVGASRRWAVAVQNAMSRSVSGVAIGRAFDRAATALGIQGQGKQASNHDRSVQLSAGAPRLKGRY